MVLYSFSCRRCELGIKNISVINVLWITFGRDCILKWFCKFLSDCFWWYLVSSCFKNCTFKSSLTIIFQSLSCSLVAALGSGLLKDNNFGVYYSTIELWRRMDQENREYSQFGTCPWLFRILTWLTGNINNTDPLIHPPWYTGDITLWNW